MLASNIKFLPNFIKVRLEASETFRKILANTGWLFIDQVVRMGCGLLVGVWVARYLGPEQFGTFNYALAFVGLFGALATLGLDSIVIRDIVRNSSSRDAVLGTAFLLKMAGAFVTLGLTLLAISIVRPEDSLSRYLVGILAAKTVFQAFDVIDCWFRSQMQSKYSVWARNTAYFIVVLVKISLILLKAPLIAFAWATAAETGLGAAGLWIAYRLQGCTLQVWRASLHQARELLRDSWPLMFSGIMIMVYMRIDQVMLGQMADDQAVGIYSAAVRLSEVGYFVPMIVASSVFPSLVHSKQLPEQEYLRRVQKYFDLNVLLAYALAIPTSILSPIIISFLYGKAYQGAEIMFSILIWASLFVFMGVAREQLLISEGMMKFSFFCTVIGAISNIALNLFLIPAYAGTGAAIATLFSYFLSGYISSFFINSPFKMGYLQTKSFFLLSYFYLNKKAQ
jgi:polysaccharide transporter, PST family